jgi:hypothetical protein
LLEKQLNFLARRGEKGSSSVAIPELMEQEADGTATSSMRSIIKKHGNGKLQTFA